MRRRDFLGAWAAAPAATSLPSKDGAGARSIAVTVDDLPAARRCFPKVDLEDFDAFRKKNIAFLSSFHKRRATLSGFVVEGFTPRAWSADKLKILLGDWLDAGAELGNHTFSHRDLYDVSMAHFQADVVLGEAALGSVLAHRGKRARFFRHPYLHTRKPGHDPHELDRFLERFGYHTAPVTVDAQDWLFAEIYAWAAARGDDVRRNAVAAAYLDYFAALLAHTEKASLETLGREPAQVLLMHASALNFDHIDAILNLIAARGYDFISLEEALKDQAYAEKLPSRGSWLNGWREVRKLPKTADPDPGKFLGTVLEDYRLVQRAHPAAAGPPAERICGC